MSQRETEGLRVSLECSILSTAVVWTQTHSGKDPYCEKGSSWASHCHAMCMGLVILVGRGGVYAIDRAWQLKDGVRAGRYVRYVLA
jgi:hypothetical protein